ncbi:maleylpyruvate isomerase family mycothiol-dependent enzyme [Kitasatospora sp. LaBMicrA B282]|uniref:maleylpyruvate isomerase family mycothiol-dependent enzyme n=1 Tax=Kitasatospora sp. LaBMicrA B282 TaxID=3420949 RepID=UPI003D12D9DA
MTTVDHQAAVATETAAFVAAVRAADLATEVPTCPGWTLADLTRHAGSAQRWFSGLLTRRVQERPTSREVELDLPDTDAGLPDWLTASAEVAAAAFAATAPETPMWVWGGPDHHARFWARRMLFETLVHRVDAQLAVGVKPSIDPALAADGVAEFLTNLPDAGFFAPGIANLRGTGETIRFARTDGPESWLVQLRADDFGLVPEDGAEPQATISGTAADLLLLLYRRVPADAPTVRTTGDQELLTRWFEHSQF